MLRALWKEKDVDWKDAKKAFRKIVIDGEKVSDKSEVDLKEFTAHYMRTDKSYDRNKSRSTSGTRGRMTSPSTWTRKPDGRYQRWDQSRSNSQNGHDG